MGNSKIVYYGETLIDLTGDTVEAAKLLMGVTAHDKKGEKITGTFEAADPYAIIGVTYPSESICTCTNGTLTLTAKGTGGKAMFVIPSAGTWTVKAVKGSQSKSVAVKITTEGQVETVALSYEYVVFADGQINSDMGALKLLYDKTGGSTWEIVGGNLTLISADGGGQRGVAYGGFSNPVAVNAERRYLCFTVVQGSGNNSQVGASVNNGEGFSAYSSTGDVSSASPKTVCIDLAAYYGNCYVKLYSWGGTAIKVSRIWLQSEELT